MDDALRVRRLQRVSNLNPQLQHPLRLQRLSSDQVLQRLPVQKLHGDERLAFGLVNRVDRADVGVVERRSGLGFALESRKCLDVSGKLLRQELERDTAMELHVLSLV